jgi:hypothetical protein
MYADNYYYYYYLISLRTALLLRRLQKVVQQPARSAQRVLRAKSERHLASPQSLRAIQSGLVLRMYKMRWMLQSLLRPLRWCLLQLLQS